MTTLIPPRSFAYIVGEELARALDLQDPLINLFGIEIAEHEATAMLAEDQDVSAIKTNGEIAIKTMPRTRRYREDVRGINDWLCLLP